MSASTITVNNKDKNHRRSDILALWAGIAFSFIFTAVIWLAGGRLDSIELLPDTGPSW